MAVKKKVVSKDKSDSEILKSIDINLRALNEFLQGEFFEKIESLDWKIWEMHGKMEKQEKSVELLEDIKSLLRVFIMNKELNPGDIQISEEKPKSIVGRLFKSKK
jgi:hypothetical protein